MAFVVFTLPLDHLFVILPFAFQVGHLIFLVRGHQCFNLVIQYVSPFVIQMLLLVGPISNDFNHLQVSVDFGR